MSRSVNRVILLGHIGKDPVSKFTATGKCVTRFSLATNRRWKDRESGDWKEETDWHNVVVWDMEQLQNYLVKGKQVYVEGSVRTRSWEDENSGQRRYVTEIIADNVILLAAKPAAEPEGAEEREKPLASAPRSQPTRSAPKPFSEEITDDDVPF